MAVQCKTLKKEAAVPRLLQQETLVPSSRTLVLSEACHGAHDLPSSVPVPGVVTLVGPEAMAATL
jgi:hypothetical protein